MNKKKLYRQEIKPIDALEFSGVVVMAFIVVAVVYGIFWTLCAALDSGAIL